MIADLDSRRNYLKQLLSGWVEMARPATTSGSKYYTDYTVTHNLGYRPLVRAWYDPTGGGMRVPMNGAWFADISQFYPSVVDFQFYVYEITTTTVTFRADSYTADGALSGNFRFFYKLYADPSRGEI